MQTMECGKHDILPVAGASQDHAGVPVMLPRETDADMRRDGSRTAPSVETKLSMSAEECTAHQDVIMTGQPSPRLINTEQRPSHPVMKRDTTANRSYR
jgi:hypothetical protein